MPDLPTPPYTEATGPQAEAKPSTSKDLQLPGEVFERAWEIWLDHFGEGNVEKLRAVGAFIFAAGRAQAAADIQAQARIEYGVEHTYPGQEPVGLPAVNRWAAERAAGQSGGVASRRLVERTTWSTPWRQAAEREKDSWTDPDEASLPASTDGGIHGETPTGGSAS